MNIPQIVSEDSFQEAWLSSLKIIRRNHWELWNLIVHIKKPLLIDNNFHNKITTFATEINIRTPKDVAYTIFPFNQYEGKGSSLNLYTGYKRFYRWTRTREHRGWGTYFYRMIHFEENNKIINQLDNIIEAINNREKNSKAALTIIIEKVGGETVRPLGAPCLNYIAVQVETNPRKINLLCVYRNHEFLERSYGNYWGLAKLLNFISTETNSQTGTITCISSHAFLMGHKRELSILMDTL